MCTYSTTVACEWWGKFREKKDIGPNYADLQVDGRCWCWTKRRRTAAQEQSGDLPACWLVSLRSLNSAAATRGSSLVDSQTGQCFPSKFDLPYIARQFSLILFQIAQSSFPLFYSQLCVIRRKAVHIRIRPLHRRDIKKILLTQLLYEIKQLFKTRII